MVTAWDGFNAGIGLVLTVLKVWLGVALAAVLAAALFDVNAAIGIPAFILVAGLVAPFLRVAWVRQLRSGLSAEQAARFRAGLVAALCAAILALWAGMTVFSAVTTGAAPGGAAAVPFALNAIVGFMALLSTALGLFVLWRLRPGAVAGDPA